MGVSRISSFVKWSAYRTGLSPWRARQRPVLRILMFHGIGGTLYPEAAFAEQMAWLKRHFEVLSFRDAFERHARGDAFTGREVVLTFDDGLRNNARLAAPVLTRLEVPATFFVCPGLIEDRSWIWNVEARERLSSLPRRSVNALAVSFDLGLDADATDEVVVERIIAWMKSLDLETRGDAEQRIVDATSTWVPTEAQHADNDMMSWDELLGLDPKWITVGSHTMYHPTLTTLSDEALRGEVRTSREVLEDRLGREVAFFCYPSGLKDARVRDVVAETYRAAVSVRPGLVDAESDPYRLPRVGAIPSHAELAWRILRP